MASLLEKISVLFSATINDVVDQALKAQSPAVISEYIRRAEESLDELQDTIAIVKGDSNIEKRKNAGLEQEIVRLQNQAETLVNAGRDAQASIVIKNKQQKTASLEKSNQALASYTLDLDRLYLAKGNLDLRINELRITRDNVESALRVAKTKNRVVNTIEDLTDVLEESGAAGMAEWAERVSEQADVRLEQVLEKNNALLDPSADPAVAAELEEMKARAGKQPSASNEATAAGTIPSTISVIVRTE